METTLTETPRKHVVMNWFSMGWQDDCALCGLFVGKAKHKLQGVPICNKCYKAYRKTKNEKLIAKANQKIIEAQREQELAKSPPETLDDYARKMW